MTAALDTNILVYASFLGRGDDEGRKSNIAQHSILRALNSAPAVYVAAHALVELHDVLVRKGGFDRVDAAAEIRKWQLSLSVIPTTSTLISNAAELATTHKLRIFDAVIMAAAAEARCDQLLTEDMQNGFIWRGVEVINPFL
jgi:predicted nucleic acid-binding protein